MRELKFRAWFPKKGYADVVSVYGDGSWDADFEYNDHDECGFGDTDGGVLMQYTGVKDKNGKEIYEGDVLKTLDENIIVEYEEDFAGFNICFGIHECTILSYDIEVIGNVYENPELS